MHLNEEEFTKLAHLCRIQCSSEEKDQLFLNVSKILSYVELLSEIGTQDITPCIQVVENLGNVMRADTTGPLLTREEFLSNAPSQIGGMIKVPSILKTAT